MNCNRLFFRTATIVGSLAAAVLATAPVGPAGAAEPLGIELNRLEEREGSCRVYLVMSNPSPRSYEALKLDLVLFGTDGVIARRVAVDTAPLRPAKTTVKLFDVNGLPCAGIGSVLLNDVIECRGTDVSTADCVASVQPSTRASVAFTK